MHGCSPSTPHPHCKPHREDSRTERTVLGGQTSETCAAGKEILAKFLGCRMRSRDSHITGGGQASPGRLFHAKATAPRTTCNPPPPPPARITNPNVHTTSVARGVAAESMDIDGD